MTKDNFTKLSLELHEALAQPLDPAEIKVKIQTVSKKNPSKALCVAYIDSRVVQERLDEVVGTMGWSTSFRLIEDNLPDSMRVECTLTLTAFLDNEFIAVSKADLGEGVAQYKGDQNVAKGAYSDAFKRAAVHFGIGRELYSLSTVWAEIDERKQIKNPKAVLAEMMGKGSDKAKKPRKPAENSSQTQSKKDESSKSESRETREATDKQKQYLTGLVKNLQSDNWLPAAERLHARPAFLESVGEVDLQNSDYKTLRQGVLASLSMDEAKAWIDSLHKIKEEQENSAEQ